MTEGQTERERESQRDSETQKGEQLATFTFIHLASESIAAD